MRVLLSALSFIMLMEGCSSAKKNSVATEKSQILWVNSYKVQISHENEDYCYQIQEGDSFGYD